MTITGNNHAEIMLPSSVAAIHCNVLQHLVGVSSSMTNIAIWLWPRALFFWQCSAPDQHYIGIALPSCS